MNQHLQPPFISICIPAYQRATYLQRLLESIAIQTFTNFEVVISDDSSDDSVKKLVDSYSDRFLIRYFKNEVPLGTPANWNAAIQKARGEWIKLMHDDDWFAQPQSLEIFASQAQQHKSLFLISAYYNYDEETRKQKPQFMSSIAKKRVLRQPAVLLARNVIGPPSVTLLHNSIKELYDERLKWRVDIEFYIRILQQQHSIQYIQQPLICVGISSSQVTVSCIYKPEVELPEGFILLEKHGVHVLKNILVYDAWWRLLRNMNIRETEQLYQYVSKLWPKVIEAMVKDLKQTPSLFLKIGVMSKLCMSISYLKNRSKI
jgi:glycosyltransferase involved in cell wall biosynthesis